MEESKLLLVGDQKSLVDLITSKENKATEQDRCLTSELKCKDKDYKVLREEDIKLLTQITTRTMVRGK